MTLSCSTEAVATASFLGKDLLKRTRTRIHTGGEGWQVGDPENLYILVSKSVVVRRTHASLASSVGPLGLRAHPGAPGGPQAGGPPGSPLADNIHAGCAGAAAAAGPPRRLLLLAAGRTVATAGSARSTGLKGSLRNGSQSWHRPSSGWRRWLRRCCCWTGAPAAAAGGV